MLPLAIDTENLNTLVLAERAWRLQPDEAHWKQLWDLHYFAGRDVVAARAFVNACPDSSVRRVALGNALRRSLAGWEAEAAYRIAITASPEQPFALIRLACLLIEQGRYEEADVLPRQSDAMHSGRSEIMHFSAAFFVHLRNCELPPAPMPLESLFLDRALVVFAACDGIYFTRFVSALIHSSVRNLGRPCCFHIHVVNQDARKRIEAWDRALGNPGIVLTVEHVDMTGLDEEARRTRFACARFCLLPHLMLVYRRPILMLDADLIVLHDLSALVACAAQGDFAL